MLSEPGEGGRKGSSCPEGRDRATGALVAGKAVWPAGEIRRARGGRRLCPGLLVPGIYAQNYTRDIRQETEEQVLAHLGG